MTLILSVEDNKADQFLNRQMIKKFNPDAEVIEAYDGEEALAYLQSGAPLPDIILLDINMPRMNGHDFLKAYAKNNERTEPPVVMLTSSQQEADVEVMSTYTCVRDYWPKPLRDENFPKIQEIIGINQ